MAYPNYTDFGGQPFGGNAWDIGSQNQKDLEEKQREDAERAEYNGMTKAQYDEAVANKKAERAKDPYAQQAQQLGMAGLQTKQMEPMGSAQMIQIMNSLEKLGQRANNPYQSVTGMGQGGLFDMLRRR